MKILVIGSGEEINQCKKRFAAHEIIGRDSFIANADSNIDAIFDFTIASDPGVARSYAGINIPVFLNSYRSTLRKILLPLGDKRPNLVFGFNGFPTLFDRDSLETTVLDHDDSSKLISICNKLSITPQVVADRVGMVTPRIICMIINEAYYTVQGGTASRDDIDLAMKLGTNYPYGPFEWCERIGIRYVYDLLEAVHADTKDERYKISELLREEYLGKK